MTWPIYKHYGNDELSITLFLEAYPGIIWKTEVGVKQSELFIIFTFHVILAYVQFLLFAASMQVKNATLQLHDICGICKG